MLFASVMFQLLFGWFVADFLAAVFHIVLDKLGGSRVESWPFLGVMVRDFRGHHEESLNPDYLGHSLFSLAPATLMLATAGAVFVLLFSLAGFPVFAGTLGLGIALSQATHRWSHADAPRPVRWLQAIGLLLTPEAHAGHHVAFDRDFGSLNGWSHPLVNFLLAVFGL